MSVDEQTNLLVSEQASSLLGKNAPTIKHSVSKAIGFGVVLMVVATLAYLGGSTNSFALRASGDSPAPAMDLAKKKGLKAGYKWACGKW